MRRTYFLLIFLFSITTAFSQAFITTWKTDNPGVSDDNQISIPTFPGETYNYTVDWGDGTSDSNVAGDITHTYTFSGTYQVSITGIFPRIYFNYDGFESNIGDKDKILAVEQWGSQAWSSMENAFNGCFNLDITANDTPDLSNVTSTFGMFYLCESLVGTSAFENWSVGNTINFSAMFRGAVLFNQNLNNWDMSNAENIALMFMDAAAFNQPIGGWDVSSVVNMNALFEGATSFDQDIGAWDTSNVTRMSGMFNDAISFNQDIGDWDVSKVTDMQGMFLRVVDFNFDISSWDVGNVENMSEMFFEAESFNQNIGGWNVSSATQMFSMFQGASSFNQNIGDWDVSNVTTMNGMFLFTDSFNQPIDNWDTSNVEDMAFMFNMTGSFNQDIGNWDVGNVVDMSGMFANSQSFNQDIGGWDMENVLNLSTMFQAAEAFDQNLGTWNIGQVQQMDDMFQSAALSQENYDSTLQGWANLPNLQSDVQFNAGNSSYCSGESARLQLINNYNWTITDAGKSNCPFITTWKTDNPGVSNDNQITIPTFPGETYNYLVDWGDSSSDANVTGDITHSYSAPGTYQVSITGDFPRVYFEAELGVNDQGQLIATPLDDNNKLISVDQWGSIEWRSMENAFFGCQNMDMLASDVPNLSQVSKMNAMFRFCTSFVGNSSIEYWNMSSIGDVQFLFSYALLFNQDIGNWDMSNVQFMSFMLDNAQVFDQDISLWNTSNVVDTQFMFQNASSFNQDISSWDLGSLERMNGMFNGATSFNQPIGTWDVSNVIFMPNVFSGATSFNQSIGNWDVSNAELMSAMFQGASSFDQDISGWNVSSAADMGFMFNGALSFNQDISAWDVSNVTDMAFMFNRALSFDQNIGNWNVSNVTDMHGMFRRTDTFDQDLGSWDITQVTDMSEMFFESGLSTENYDNTIIGWANLPVLQNNVVFDAGDSQYCAAGEARQSILDTYGWTISDGGPNTECFFITTWKTDNPGVSNDNQITIPTFPGETYDYIVDWGDGSSDSNVTGEITHTYSTPGTYQVSISGDFPRIYFNDDGDKNKLLLVNQWGLISWSSMDNAFWGCQNLDISASDFPDLSNVTSIRLMLKDCASLIGESIGSWDVSTIEDFSNLFDNATIFNQDLNSWDVSSARNMNAVFDTAINFNGNISDWNVSNVIFMSNMFRQAYVFDQDVSAWDVSQVSNFSNMFNSATVFNQDVSGWEVGNGRLFGAMFASMDFFNQDLSGWDMSNAESLSGMFGQARAFNQDIGNWNVSNVTNMGGLFWRAEAFNADISNWDVSNVTDMIAMFSEASSFDRNLGGWDVSNVTRMDDMFFNTGLSLGNYDNTILGWASLSSLQSDVVFNAGNSLFCESADARQFIIDTYGWTITDGGEAPLCNEDNDGDGVLDHKDLCLNTPAGVAVNSNGCDLIANDAIRVLALTPSCVDSSDGSIAINMDSSGYLLDIAIDGEGLSNEFADVASGTDFEVDNLPVGAYTVTISIPEILFERIFGVTVNPLESVSGKRQFLDSQGRRVSYLVSGSKNYTVSVNGENRNFQFEDSGPQTIFVESLGGETEIVITGESDCQGIIKDSFFVEDSLSVFPTMVSENFSVISASRDMELVIYDVGGKVVQPLQPLEFSNQEAEVDISLLPSGLYLVNLREGKKVKTIKIIKR